MLKFATSNLEYEFKVAFLDIADFFGLNMGEFIYSDEKGNVR